MILTELNYSQNIGKYDEWYLKDLRLRNLNLIASKNAVGKTRTINVIFHLAEMLSGKRTRLSNGDFNLKFKRDRGSLKYHLLTENAKVIEESLTENRRLLFRRVGQQGKIVHLRDGLRESHNYSPPINKLTNQIRRDLKELPYLEDLTRWAENLYSVTFSDMKANIIPMMFRGEGPPDYFVGNLQLSPFMLEEIIGNNNIKQRILRDINYVGYPIIDIDTTVPSVPNAPENSRIFRVQEKGLKHHIDQMNFSQGMYRVIAVIVALNYLLEKTSDTTLLSDDFAEGLDFQRASQLAKIVFKRLRNAKTQILLTSNERFLMNAVDLKYWNILERNGHTVQAFNYGNSKRLFNEFARVGLNNFDFFANQLYREQGNV
jgi:hypothetical protein